jgi:hypothetical protein
MVAVRMRGSGASKGFGIVLALLAAGLFVACAAEYPKIVSTISTEPGLNNEGRISGGILDGTRQPVIGAVVEVINPAGKTVVGSASDLGGQFMTPPLPPGTYSLVIKALGFYSAKANEILVCAGRNTKLKCTLSGKSDFTMADDWPWIKPHSTTTGAVISEGRNGQIYVDPY